MWEPRRLRTLWASTACRRDSFTKIQLGSYDTFGPSLTGAQWAHLSWLPVLLKRLAGTLFPVSFLTVSCALVINLSSSALCVNVLCVRHANQQGPPVMSLTVNTSDAPCQVSSYRQTDGPGHTLLDLVTIKSTVYEPSRYDITVIVMF
jgi:hypothetical protein